MRSLGEYTCHGNKAQHSQGARYWELFHNDSAVNIYRQSLYPELNGGTEVKWKIILLNYKALLKLFCF